MKKRSFRKICVLVFVLALSMNLCLPTFASGGISTYAISGTGSVKLQNGYGNFKVYSPDWSLFGHATVTISGASAGAVTAIQIRDSNNRLITGDYGLTLNGNSTETIKITNAPAGNYTVIAQSSEDIVVTVTLGDWW